MRPEGRLIVISIKNVYVGGWTSGFYYHLVAYFLVKDDVQAESPAIVSLIDEVLYITMCCLRCELLLTSLVWKHISRIIVYIHMFIYTLYISLCDVLFVDIVIRSQYAYVL